MKKCFMSLWAFVFVSLGIVSNAVAGLIITSDQLYLDRANSHPYVGFVEGNGSFAGSGVLVAPNWVLMSAHQGTNAFGTPVHPPRYDQYAFGLGSNQINARGEHQIASELFINPTYRGIGLGGSGYDLAMLYFENPFLSVTPVDLLLGTVVAGMDSDIVGYGLNQMVNTTDVFFTGDRRAGNNVTRVLGSSLPEFFQSSLRDSSSSTFRPLGMGGRSGDSGGALIIVGQLAGIVSGGSNSNVIGEITSYSRLDLAWMNSTMQSRPSSPVPEPCSLLLLSCAGGAMIHFRRRRF
jgi:hypothetical protein